MSEQTFLGNDSDLNETPPAKPSTRPEKPPAPSEKPAAKKMEDDLGTYVATKTPTTPGGWSVPATTRAVSPLAASQGEFEPGTVLGERYEILALLGQGGMGAVYKARDNELDRLVALKIIRPELTTNPEILKRFKQELILARQVTHRNVIRIFDLGQADGVKFITMEYLEGHDLRSELRDKGKFSPEDAARIILQICRALEAAHGEGVIHRDLKPQNIMLDGSGRAYVMDFGIARSAYLPGMTQTGALIGTPEYMSPEQAKGEKLDERSDLFSLGVIFYELLTGQSPYYSDTPLATLWKRIQEKAKPLIEVDPTIPKEISDIVAKALEIDANDRFSHATEMAQHLESFLGISKLTMSPIVLPEAVPAKPALPRTWIAAGASVALLLLVGVFLLRGKLFPGTGKPVAPPEPAVMAVIPLRNASGDGTLDWLGASVAEVLRTEIGQSRDFRTVSPDRLQQVLSDLRITPQSEVAASDLQKVAQFTKASMVVWGQYVKVGDRIRIDGKLDDLKEQRSVPLTMEAAGETALLGSLDKLAQTVQQNIRLERGSVQDLKAASFKPSSNSIEAVRAYTEGMAQSRQGNYIEAVKQFEAATKADGNFALAYSMLGQTYARLGYDRQAEQSSTKSVELSANLSPVEKYTIQAVDARIGNNYQKALEAYGNLEKLMPSDPQVQYEIGELCEKHGEYDKAHAHYDKAVQADPKHLEALRGIGQVEYERGNPQGSLDYLNRALSLAVEVNNRQGKAVVLHDLGEAYLGLNRSQDALQNFTQSLEIKKQIGDKKGTAASLDAIAQTYGAMGKTAEAEKTFQEELNIRKDIGDQEGLGVALLNYGAYLQDSGRYEDGLKRAKEALQIEMQLGHEPRQATLLNNIAVCYTNLAQYDDGLMYQQRAIDLLQKSNASPAELARNLSNIGFIYALIGQYDKALNSDVQALDQARKVGDKVQMAATSDNMAELLSIQGRYGAALKAQQDAVATAQQAQQGGDLNTEIQADYAAILNRLGRADEATKTLEESIKAAEGSKNDALQAKAYNFQGEGFYLRGDYKSARASFEKSQQAATRAKDKLKILAARHNLAKATIKEGRAGAAVPVLKDLVKEANGLGVKYLATQCSLALGEAMVASGDTTRGRPELESALRKSEDMGMKSLQPEAHYELSRALAKGGNAAEASRHLKTAAQLVQEMKQESHSEAIVQRSDFKPILDEAAK